MLRTTTAISRVMSPERAVICRHLLPRCHANGRHVRVLHGAPCSHDGLGSKHFAASPPSCCRAAISDKGHNGCSTAGASFAFPGCSECAGNCITDDDCKEDLKCFQREASTKFVPGCTTEPNSPYVKTFGSDHNYCYDEAGVLSARIAGCVVGSVVVSVCARVLLMTVVPPQTCSGGAGLTCT